MFTRKSLFVLLFLIPFYVISQEIVLDKRPDQRGIVYLESQTFIGEEALPADNNFVFYPVQIVRDHQLYTRSGNKVLKTSKAADVLFPGELAAWEINTADQSLKFIPPTYSLHANAIAAMDQAPKWLRMDLLRQFRKLNRFALDGIYAGLILSAEEKIKDEVAFQVANIPVESLRDTRLRTQMNLIITNAELIYAIADSLKFVELVEYGSYANRDYYTVTKYRVKDGNNYIWYEIPRDVYYWYIVHPRLYQEGVYEKDNSSSTQQRTWGYFWREYLWFNPDTIYDYTQVNKTTSLGTVATIPRLGETMQIPDYLWDRNTSESAFWLFNRTIKESDHALNRLGWWASRCVPVDPGTIRPIQPNQIAYEHWGRCGEDTYLLTAAARTCLIPTTYMGTMGEDHVWCGVYENDVFNHFEFFRGGLQQSGWGWTSTMKGGGYERLSSTWIMSHIMTYRPDGAIGQNTKDYTDVCYMTVNIADSEGKPVDGAKAVLYCKPGAYSDVWQKAGYWFTNHTGSFTIPLGDNKQYGFQIEHPKFGIQPTPTTLWPVLQSKAVKNEQYTANLVFADKKMPASPISKSSSVPNSADYGIHLDFFAAEIIAGTHSDDAQRCQHALRSIESGAVGFFICNEENYNRFKAGHTAEVYEWVGHFGSGNIWMPLPGAGKWYVVLSNWHSTVNYQEFEASFELVSNANKVGMENMLKNETNFRIYPNPAQGRVNITAPDNTLKVEVFDVLGNRVEELNTYPYVWNVDNKTARGTYLIRVTLSDRTFTGRVVINK